MSTAVMSLRNARRFEQDVVAKLISRIGEEIKTTQTVSIFTELTLDTTISMQSKLLGKVTQVRHLIEFRYALRGDIRRANQSGVNMWTLALARDEEVIRFLSAMLVPAKSDDDGFYHRRQPKAKRATVQEAINLSELNLQFLAMRASVANGQAATTYDLNLLTPVVINSVDALISTYREAVIRARDELTTLNNNTTISVRMSPEIDAIFKEYHVTVG